MILLIDIGNTNTVCAVHNNEKYIAYISSGKKKYKSNSQLWLINLKTARKRQLTKIANDVTDFQWSPDGEKIAIVVHHKKDDIKGTKPPIVVDRYQFKKDGYDFIESENKHIHIMHLDKRISSASIFNID